jgi:hypothetical protein
MAPGSKSRFMFRVQLLSDVVTKLYAIVIVRQDVRNKELTS